MTTDYGRGYAKGYSKGSQGKWPDYRPITPPDELIGGLVTALQKLRDAVDAELAMMDPDDPWEHKLGPLVEAADDQLTKLGRWIRNGEAEQVQTVQADSQHPVLAAVQRAEETAERTTRAVEV